MKTAKEKAIFDKACRIYAAMPGAQQPPQSTHVDGQLRTLWGEVDYTPEFKFCEAIAREITDSALAAIATSVEASVSAALVEMAECIQAACDDDATVPEAPSRPN